MCEAIKSAARPGGAEQGVSDKCRCFFPTFISPRILRIPPGLILKLLFNASWPPFGRSEAALGLLLAALELFWAALNRS